MRDERQEVPAVPLGIGLDGRIVVIGQRPVGQILQGWAGAEQRIADAKARELDRADPGRVAPEDIAELEEAGIQIDLRFQDSDEC